MMKNQVQALIQHLFVSFFCILPLSFIAIPILLFTVIFFGTIRICIGIFLKIKYSKQFYGLFKCSDAIWTIKDPSAQAAISTVWVIESKKSLKEFVEYIRNDVCSSIVNHPSNKMSCTRHRKLGYSFLLKSSCSLSDFQKNCVRNIKIKGNFNRNSLKKIVADNLNNEMPFNDTALWEILVFDKEIGWNSNEKNHFAVGFRVHHCIADGISLMKLLLEHFSDKKRAENELTSIMSPGKISLRKKINRYCQILETFVFGPAVLLIGIILGPRDLNILHGPPLSGQVIVTFIAESQPEFVIMVKQIKAKFTSSGMRFTDVVFAGIAASFHDYYKKRGNVPKYISTLIPAYFSNNFNISEKNALTNSNYSPGTAKLTISKNGQGVLQEIHEKMDKLRNSSEYAVNYYLLPVIAAVLPESLVRKIVHGIRCTLVISCLPGSEKLKVFRGDELQDVVFWLPNRGFTGVGVSVLSYGGRFQIGLTVDKTLVPDEESAQEIIDGVFKHIRNMYNSFVL